MKKEVVVCDAPDCRRLADCTCPICERDFCREHRKAFVEVIVVNKRAEPRPSTHPPPPSNPSEPYYVTNNERTERVEMCNGCWDECSGVERASTDYKTRSMFTNFAQAASIKLVSIIRAKLAEHKLRK